MKPPPPPLLRRPLLLTVVYLRLSEGDPLRATWPSSMRCSARIDSISVHTLPPSTTSHHRHSAASTIGHKVRYVSQVAGGFWRGRKRGLLDRLRCGAASLLQQLWSVARSVLFVLEAIVLLGMTNIDSDHPHTITEWLIFINCVLFLAQLLDARVTQLLISDKSRICRGEKYRLLTSMFVHRDLGHLLANCAGLHFIGPDAEKLYTSKISYLALYMLSGLCGGLFTHKLSAASRWLGASGGIMGLMGAVGFYCWRHKDWFEVRTPLRQITQSVGLCLYEGLKDPTIDNIGHLGGLLGGISCGYLFGPRLVYVRKWWQPYSSGPGVETVDLPILEDVLRRAKAGVAWRVKRWAT